MSPGPELYRFEMQRNASMHACMHTKGKKMEISPRIAVYLRHYLGCLLVDYGVCSADIVRICMVDSVCTARIRSERCKYRTHALICTADLFSEKYKM
jgi:hypothetical protein